MCRAKLATGVVAAAMLRFGAASRAAHAQLMIIGNDQKAGLDAQRKPIMRGPGGDTLSVVDMSNPAALELVATIRSTTR